MPEPQSPEMPQDETAPPRDKRTTATCQHCGSPYAQLRSNQRYCTLICRNRANHARHRTSYNQWRMNHYYRAKASTPATATDQEPRYDYS